MFQFLVGRLKTLPGGGGEKIKDFVSIPRR